jgi:hypothetical protein
MSQYIFEDYIKALKIEDTFRTFGMVFEAGLDKEARKNLIKTPMTEKRNGVRSVSERVLVDQNSFYVVGVFLKVLNEIGFRVEETVEEGCDFCGIMLPNEHLQLSVEFSYGSGFEVEYSVLYISENFLNSDGWGMLDFSNTLNPFNLFEDLETFIQDFRKSWGKYQKIIKDKTL